MLGKLYRYLHSVSDVNLPRMPMLVHTLATSLPRYDNIVFASPILYENRLSNNSLHSAV